MPLTRSDACKRARSLLAQAADDSVTLEEARSFAHRAAKLIDKHDLYVVEVDPPRVAEGVVPPEAGEAIGAVVDLVDRFSKSGLVDALKRTVSAGSRMRDRARERQAREPRRRRDRG
jgi:hypothetical protein